MEPEPATPPLPDRKALLAAALGIPPEFLGEPREVEVDVRAVACPVCQAERQGLCVFSHEHDGQVCSTVMLEQAHLGRMLLAVQVETMLAALQVGGRTLLPHQQEQVRAHAERRAGCRPVAR